jgi:hypothetical protein
MTFSVTPFEHLFSEEQQAVLDEENRYAVPGDFAYLRHDAEKVNVIWLCVNLSESCYQRSKLRIRDWIPFAWIESGKVGRAFYNWPVVRRWLNFAHKVSFIDWSVYGYSSPYMLNQAVEREWGEVDARLQPMLVPAFLFRPVRGMPPMAAYDWCVNGEFVASYKPTWKHFPHMGGLYMHAWDGGLGGKYIETQEWKAWSRAWSVGLAGSPLYQPDPIPLNWPHTRIPNAIYDAVRSLEQEVTKRAALEFPHLTDRTQVS